MRRAPCARRTGAAHASRIWSEDTVLVHGAGTITLHEGGALSGRLEEQVAATEESSASDESSAGAGVAAAGVAAAPRAAERASTTSTTSTTEVCVGAWDGRGMVQLVGGRCASRHDGAPHGAPQDARSHYLHLAVEEAHVTVASQRWVLAGREALVRRGRPGAELGALDAEVLDAAELDGAPRAQSKHTRAYKARNRGIEMEWQLLYTS